MLFLFLCLFLFCASASAAAMEKQHYSLEEADKHFVQFVKTHQKYYSSEAEKQMRFKIFKQNLEKINQLNVEQPFAVFGINQFSDLTEEEMFRLYTGARVDMADQLPAVPAVNVSRGAKMHLPENFDWREKNVVTPVKNQERCGSCWAFSTTGALEGAYAIKHGKLLSFSEQQLMDCDTSSCGCNGGWPSKALRYLQSVGAEGESDYPYEKRQGQCRFDRKRVKARVTGQQSIPFANEDAMRQSLMDHGPISIGLDASYFQHYHGGILNCPPGPLGHAVLLVGFGTENGHPYWIIKNSWGQWGEAGYIRVLRSGNPCGMMNPYALVAQVA